MIPGSRLAMKKVHERKRTMNRNLVKSTLLGTSLVALLAFAAHAEALKPLNSDSEPVRRSAARR